MRTTQTTSSCRQPAIHNPQSAVEQVILSKVHFAPFPRSEHPQEATQTVVLKGVMREERLAQLGPRRDKTCRTLHIPRRFSAPGTQTKLKPRAERGKVGRVSRPDGSLGHSQEQSLTYRRWGTAPMRINCRPEEVGRVPPAVGPR